MSWYVALSAILACGERLELAGDSDRAGNPGLSGQCSQYVQPLTCLRPNPDFSGDGAVLIYRVAYTNRCSANHRSVALGEHNGEQTRRGTTS